MPTDSYVFRIIERLDNFEFVRIDDANTKLLLSTVTYRKFMRSGFVPDIFEEDETKDDYNLLLFKNIDEIKKLEKVRFVLPDEMRKTNHDQSQEVEINVQMETDKSVQIKQLEYQVYVHYTPVRQYLKDLPRIRVSSATLADDDTLILTYAVNSD